MENPPFSDPKTEHEGAEAPSTSSQPTSKKRRNAIIIGAVVVLLFLLTGNFGTLLILLGFGVAGLGAYALAKGGLARFRLNSKKAGAVALAAGLLVAAIGGGANAAAAGGASSNAAQSESVRGAAPATPSETPTPQAKPKATTSVAPKPVELVSEAKEAQAVPHAFARVEDANYDAGFEGVTVAGAAGEKIVTYKITTRDGVEVSREVISEVVTLAPVDEVTTVGTREPAPVVEAPVAESPDAGGCDSNYTGACVPIASDVDCAGGSGNGPAYVEGPVQVVGSDIYDLDRDGDGIACD